jgi:hypothetical protein
MRRLLFTVLMLVLSLQSVWAAAASACMHEQTMTRTHFGHHEPHHETSQRDALQEAGWSNLAQADHHHFLNVTPVPHVPALPAVVIDAGTVVVHAVDLYPGIPIAALERPPKDLAELVSARSGWRRITHSL